MGERLFTFQSSQEMNFKEGKRSTEWVNRLSQVVLALNREEAILTGKKPVDAIKDKAVIMRKRNSNYHVRYLSAAGGLEGSQRRATDPI